MDSHKYYSREFYDRYAQGQEKSVVNKMQQKYWKTKQTLIKVTGKKEDEHVVASDADLDAKLELFHSIQRTCMDLLKAIELYQKRICFLSQEENELGKFLRSQGSQDKTRAGKMMQATGKALCFSSQQRLALRTPLCRLYQEVETFRYRAISDTWLTVNRMEQCRTEYRGALLWMKDVSQELDPDLYKQMEKFRKVQAQVRQSKLSFDKLKTDVCQKVDLLGASRCNLLSHILTTYQTTLLHFWEKTSRTMAAIHESFKGYQPYNFIMLKSLQEPESKLVESEEKEEELQLENTKSEDDQQSQLISLDDENHTKESLSTAEDAKDILSTFGEDSEQEFNRENSGAIDDLLGLKPEESGSKYLLTNSLEPEAADKADMVLLNEILNASSLDDGEFSWEWTPGFGEDSLADTPANSSMGEMEGNHPSSSSSSGFLPSQLLDQNMNNLQSSFQGWAASSSISPSPAPQPAQKPGSLNMKSVKEPASSSKDLTAWFSLFADLDPLSNPDAVGKTDKEHELFNA
ncbi:islet cell autoantigen 1 isoform X1 [Pogona vitticeps]